MNLVSRYLDPDLVQRLNHVQLSARRVVEGSALGLHRSPLKGASIEFRQHRSYVPGDDPRRLDWRVLGRTDRPFVKEYDEETNLRCLLLLDRSGSMGYGGDSSGNKLEYAAKVTAGLAYVLLGHGESAGLGVFGAGLEGWLTPRVAEGQLARIVSMLEQTAAGGTSDVARSVHAAAGRLGRRALVVILSDLFSPAAGVREALAHLRHDGHEVMIVRVLHPDELTFPFRRWVRLSGLEGEKPRLMEPALQRKIYLENFARHSHDLEAAAHAMGAALETLQTDQDVGSALVSLLARRAIR